jgi:hypothetical protein
MNELNIEYFGRAYINQYDKFIIIGESKKNYKPESEKKRVKFNEVVTEKYIFINNLKFVNIR